MRRTLVFLLCLAATAFGQNDALREQLSRLEGVAEVLPMKVDPMFNAGFELRVRQPLDHAHPGGKTFLQSVYVANLDVSAPVLFETEGYAARGGGRPKELTALLKSNQVVVEHRFFGRSVPDSLDWKYLTTKQAADDHHRIVTMLKSIYGGKWISSGTSKGGQTALFYRYYYPHDVDATVPYVAPVNLSQEDPRIQTFLRTVGTPEERKRIREFQIAMLRREREMLPLVDSLAVKKGYTFSIGKAKAYEYTVLEYPCAFWQYGSRTSSIPSSEAPADSMFGHLDRVATMFYYADQGIRAFEPFQYQAYTEIGYYGYDITDFRGLLTAVSDPTNIILAPRNADLTFDPRTMHNVYTWLRDHGSNIIYLYGENDLWSATAMELAGKTNAVKVVKAGGSHRTRIADLAPEQKETVYRALEEWTGVKIQR